MHTHTHTPITITLYPLNLISSKKKLSKNKSFSNYMDEVKYGSTNTVQQQPNIKWTASFIIRFDPPG